MGNRDAAGVGHEQYFFGRSHGFRLYRSVHQALLEIRGALMTQGLRWVVDISKYSDTIDHDHPRPTAQLPRLASDRRVIRRMIDKWLKAGVLEAGLLQCSTEGTPQAVKTVIPQL